MTYLEIVNAVMRRLREEQVATVGESDYSLMVGDLVNQARRLVEDSWDWTALRNTVDLQTIAGTAVYSLTDHGVRSRILSIHNETTNTVVREESVRRIRELNLGTDNAQGTVNYYAVDGTDSNNDLRIRLYQTPNASQDLTIYTVQRNDDFVNDFDTTKLPSTPIIQWAYSYALIERGETGGQSGAEMALFAKNDLATAISLDAGQHPEELIWETV